MAGTVKLWAGKPKYDRHLRAWRGAGGGAGGRGERGDATKRGGLVAGLVFLEGVAEESEVVAVRGEEPEAFLVLGEPEADAGDGGVAGGDGEARGARLGGEAGHAGDAGALVGVGGAAWRGQGRVAVGNDGDAVAVVDCTGAEDMDGYVTRGYFRAVWGRRLPHGSTGPPACPTIPGSQTQPRRGWMHPAPEQRCRIPPSRNPGGAV